MVARPAGCSFSTGVNRNVKNHVPRVPGEELILTADDVTVAVLTRTPQASWPCEPGIAAGTPFWMAPDFDAPLEDFEDDKS